MNAVVHMNRNGLESEVRAALSDPAKQADILEATGWDQSMLSKVRSGQAGITLDKLNPILVACGLVLSTPSYMDYLARGNVIGSNCVCARMGNGECGRRH